MFEVLYVVRSCRVVVLAAFDCCLDLLGCDVYLSWMYSEYFPCYFPVCSVRFCLNCVHELYVEGTCNVFGVNVCVVFECYGVGVLLCWSFVC